MIEYFVWDHLHMFFFLVIIYLRSILNKLIQILFTPTANFMPFW